MLYAKAIQFPNFQFPIEGCRKMKILVCTKQVPESESAVEMDGDGKWITHAAGASFKMNRFDAHALEAALVLKESHPGVRIDAITVGPGRADETIKKALGMGADQGIHILSENAGYSDPYGVAWRIAEEARKENHDLILTGVMSEDLMQAQTGQMIAEILNLPWASAVVSLEVDPGRGEAVIEREMEGGMRERLEMDLPAVFTIQAGINIPRYPTLSNILSAHEKEAIVVRDNAPPERQVVVGIGLPEKIREGRVLEGSAEEKARTLVRMLRKENALRGVQP